MSENFRKIKKKYTVAAIVAGCILGVCLGVALTCALAVVIKTTGVNLHWAIYIPIALVLSAGAGWLFYLILRPSDKRVAKKLDKDYSLNQKVQTMVEFAHVDGDLPALQREQTDEALKEVAKKRVDLKWLAKFAFVPVIAAAMLFAGIFVPAKKSSGEVDPGYSLTDLQKASIEALITDVENSSLTTELKAFTVLELTGLLDMLDKAEYQSVMETAVITAVHNIDAMVAESNSYLKIDGVFAENAVLKPFSQAVVDAVTDYKSRGSKRLSDMSIVEAYVQSSETRMPAVLGRWKKSYLAEFAPKAEGSDTVTYLSVVQSAEKLQTFADAVKDGLERYSAASGEATVLFAAAEEDALYTVYDGVAEGVYGLIDEGVGGVYSDSESYYNAIDAYFTGFTESDTVIDALTGQSYSCMMDDFIRVRLATIFGWNTGIFGSNELVAPTPAEDENGGSNNDREETGGSRGPGDHIYGSDDKFLDPDSGESKKYGDYINPDNTAEGTFFQKYKGFAEAYANSDSCPPDVAKFIKQYYLLLENGIKEDGKN